MVYLAGLVLGLAAVAAVIGVLLAFSTPPMDRGRHRSDRPARYAVTRHRRGDAHVGADGHTVS